MIEAFAEKAGFRLKNIYVIDGSKRSTKANAYFSGFGSKKRIVLYDTLIREMSDEEIVARVDALLKNLGLLEIRDMKVGSPLNKKISGGQRKRLNISLELIRVMLQFHLRK